MLPNNCTGSVEGDVENDETGRGVAKQQHLIYGEGSDHSAGPDLLRILKLREVANQEHLASMKDWEKAPRFPCVY